MFCNSVHLHISSLVKLFHWAFYNGLSDPDAQILVLRNINIQYQKVQHTVKRQINEITMAQFKLNLIYENWLDTINEEDVDWSFDKFLNVYLRIFYHIFPLKKYYNSCTK